MGRKVEISHADRRFLNEILDALALTQKELAVKTSVSQPWLSQTLKGKRTSVEAERLERVAKTLMEMLRRREADTRFTKERTQAALTFLNGFSIGETDQSASKLSRPGDVIPVDATNYVERGADGYALEALQDMPFTMLVSGAANCGKSSLLARLEHRARDRGLETAWFDPKRVNQQSDITSTATIGLYELLQLQWELEPLSPRDGAPDSIPMLFHWLLKTLAPTANKPRLLILDDLASLGSRAVDDWLSLFARGMHNKRATMGLQVSIAVGLTNHFGTSFQKRLMDISSVVHWWPKIELSWLSRADVIELERSVTGVALEQSDLFDLLSGQPYLTHAAAVDRNFRDAVRKWMANPSEDNAPPVRGARAYRQHLNAIRSAVLGPTWDSEISPRLLKEFVEACASNKAPSNADHRLFFENAKLLNADGEPALQIYRLIAEDLSELIPRST
ncbi:MAG TPA: helix-turn-helix transcriptional regulator [Pyrinomonadaceae bacterium]